VSAIASVPVLDEKEMVPSTVSVGSSFDVTLEIDGRTWTMSVESAEVLSVALRAASRRSA